MMSTLPRWRPSRREVFAATVAAIIGVLVLVLYLAALLENLERESVDQRFSLRGSQPPGSEIVIVGIDQKTMEELGVRPPLPRPDYAQVLDQVGAGSPRLIVVDVEFRGRTEGDPAGDNELLAAIARNGPMVLATREGSEGAMTVPAGVPDAPGAVIASDAVERDPDGLLRRMLYAQVDLETLPVRGAEMLRNQPVDEGEFPRQPRPDRLPRAPGHVPALLVFRRDGGPDPGERVHR